MSISERIFRTKAETKTSAEKFTTLAKIVDVATVLGAYVVAAVYPPLVGAANAAIQFSVGTYALTKAAEAEIKKHRKN